LDRLAFFENLLKREKEEDHTKITKKPRSQRRGKRCFCPLS